MCLTATVSSAILPGEVPQPDNAVQSALRNHQFDLKHEGREFLVAEAKSSDFFLLGELHGENEIPALLAVLWPQMWKEGYRHMAAEVSPWAAYQLELVPVGKGPVVQSPLTKEQSATVHALADSHTNVLWGCDMEEEQPEFLIRELAARNPDDPNLKRMVTLTKNGYTRKMAPELLNLARESKSDRDEVLNDGSLRQNLLATLEIETNRLNPETKMIAQNERELLMKQQFLAHFRHSFTSASPSKVLLRFGRNHLHRGFDARGIALGMGKEGEKHVLGVWQGATENTGKPLFRKSAAISRSRPTEPGPRTGCRPKMRKHMGRSRVSNFDFRVSIF